MKSFQKQFKKKMFLRFVDRCEVCTESQVIGMKCVFREKKAFNAHI